MGAAPHKKCRFSSGFECYRRTAIVILRTMAAQYWYIGPRKSAKLHISCRPSNPTSRKSLPVSSSIRSQSSVRDKPSFEEVRLKLSTGRIRPLPCRGEEIVRSTAILPPSLELRTVNCSKLSARTCRGSTLTKDPSASSILSILRNG